MNFDTIIIGGGLAGLASAIDLQKRGQRCAVISLGHSCLYFGSGSFDLLNTLPDGSSVNNPLEAIDKLIEQSPLHPYSKLGKANFASKAKCAKELLLEAEVGVQGSADNNHFRLSPIGSTASTWLTLDGYPTFDGSNVGWKKVIIVSPDGYLDALSRFVRKEFSKQEIECQIELFTLPSLDKIKDNPTEFRSENIDRMFKEHPEQVDVLVDIICQKANASHDAVLIPACFSDNQILDKVKARIQNENVFWLPTMPPVVKGVDTEYKLRQYFKKLGGEFFSGDSVVKGEFEGNRLKYIYTKNHEDMPFCANNYILATGSFFSKGLLATHEHIIEPIFGLDIASSDKREDWYDKHFYAPQNYMGYGIDTDNEFRVLKNKTVITNLYAAGAILGHHKPVEEGSGAGVALLPSLQISENILSQI